MECVYVMCTVPFVRLSGEMSGRKNCVPVWLTGGALCSITVHLSDWAFDMLSAMAFSC